MAVEILEIKANIDDIGIKLNQVNALLDQTNKKAVINVDGKKGFDGVEQSAKDTTKAIDGAGARQKKRVKRLTRIIRPPKKAVKLL